MSKHLFIISDYISSEEKLFNFNSDTDLLALSPLSMLSLDSMNKKYKTLDDYINVNEYRNEVYEMLFFAEKTFEKLDKICFDSINFPYGYSGNSAFFFQFLSSLLYIENFCLNVKRKYDKVFLFGNNKPEKLSWDNLSYNKLNNQPTVRTIQIPQAIGLYNNICIVNDILKLDFIQIKEKNYGIPITVKIESNLNLIIRYIKFSIQNNKIPFLEKILVKNKHNFSKKTIGIISGGYEVSELTKYMMNYNFVDFHTSLRKKIANYKPKKYSFEKIESILKPFLKKYWPNLNQSILLLFSSYHREVVGRLNYYNDAFEKVRKNLNPITILSSVGTGDVIDCFFAYKSNKKNIPVVYFQHGGTSAFYNNYFDKYVEKDKKIKHTLILNSKLEELENKDGSTHKGLGSISKFNFVNSFSKKNKKRAIYCCGPFPIRSYRTILSNNTDKTFYQSSREIIEEAIDCSIKLDIKPHPETKRAQYNYFSKLINLKNRKKIKLINPLSVESVLKSYSLVILDFNASALLPLVLSLNIPLILYFKDKKIINNKTLPDLRERAHIIGNPMDLKVAFNNYNINKLKSNWSSEIIDKYIYPLDNGNPGPNIATYIESLNNN